MNIRNASLVTLGLVLAITTSSFAQKGMTVAGDDSPDATKAPPKDVRPPAPSEPEKFNIVIPYLLTFVLGASAVGLAILPSRRTHQD